MTALWLAFKSSRYARWIAMVGALLLAVLTFGRVKKREGRKEERDRQEEVDHENAANIRQRVDAVKPVHDDDLKFRD